LLSNNGGGVGLNHLEGQKGTEKTEAGENASRKGGRRMAKR